MKQQRIAVAALLVAMIGGCEPAESVDIQPLPPEERPSAEARLGLPEVQGVWRFAGWELPPGDSAALDGTLPSLGQFDIQVQRLDSIAGLYVSNGFGAPIAGEVRRDSILTLVTMVAGRSFAAGEVSGDTLWISLSSIVPQEAWPGGKAAFVRGQAQGPVFARLEGAVPPRPPSMAMGDAAAQDSAVNRDFRTAPPRQTAPQEIRPAPPVIAPEPEPEVVAPVVTPERKMPELLGTPVVRDTTGEFQ